MRLVSALHLGLIGPLRVGICYAGCPKGPLLGPCDCPPFFPI
ncbi:hypothetical protein ACIBTV_27800 [Micromonospora sp. NPDC049366]